MKGVVWDCGPGEDVDGWFVHVYFDGKQARVYVPQRQLERWRGMPNERIVFAIQELTQHVKRTRIRAKAERYGKTY